jgi:hypothetical protein
MQKCHQKEGEGEKLKISAGRAKHHGCDDRLLPDFGSRDDVFWQSCHARYKRMRNTRPEMKPKNLCTKPYVMGSPKSSEGRRGAGVPHGGGELNTF